MRFAVEIIGKNGLEYNYESQLFDTGTYSDSCWQKFLEDNKLNLSNILGAGSDQSTNAYISVSTTSLDGYIDIVARYDRNSFNSKYKV